MRHNAALLTLVFGLAACTDTIDHNTLDAALDLHLADTVAHEAQPADDAASPMLSIFIRGESTPTTFTDGYSGQTPKEYRMGLGRFDIMTSAADPSPVTVFDHGASPVEVDMLSKTLGGQAPIADLPAGTYTHGRVLLTMTSFTVAATVHIGAAVPGDLKVVVALSDTTVGGAAWSKGKATFTFAQQTLPAVVPPFPTTGGGAVVEEPGKTWLVFPFPAPITLSPTTASHTATIVYKVYQAFRWEDESKAGYAPGAFDVDPLAMSWEPLKNFGATGYAVELN